MALLKDSVTSLIASQVPLASHTTMKVGGPARHFAVAENREELIALLGWAKERGQPVFILGAGSNVIIADEGFPGLVLLLGRAFRNVTVEEEDRRVVSGAASPMPLLGRAGVERGWGDFVFLCGIPGVIGAGVRMNAGTGGGELSHIFEWAEIITSDGKMKRLSREELTFGYRASSLKEMKGAVVMRVCLRSDEEPLPPAKTLALAREELEKRLLRQPENHRNCGSVFKNPPGLSAGKLIEEAGLKGARVGDAEVSREHANWIVNRGNATGSDIRALIERIQEEVYKASGVNLQREVVLIPEDILDG
ncbi:UDP-N-acetylmuramate dehydrogenase [bacterium]|nr:MAG: UDP-N-acetylmuramate dehydrogenase [bacterium]